MIKSIHFQNDWDKVRKIRKELTREDVENYPFYAGHEAQWQTLQSFNSYKDEGGNLKEFTDREDDEKTAGTPLRAFKHFIEMGFSPPPEILIWMVDAFDYYYSQRGNVALEDVFFGSTKSGVGNFSARSAKDTPYRILDMEISFNKIKHKKTQKQIALELLESYGLADFVDVENFLRSFRRWKKTKSDTSLNL
jgi:hypothetical protein